MLNRAIFDDVKKSIKHLTKHCGQCRMCSECEEKTATGDNDYEPRYCISIIEAAIFNATSFKIPFPKKDKVK